MKRYPLWKHLLVAALLALAGLYALPSAYPTAPALELRGDRGVSGAALRAAAAELLAAEGIEPAGARVEEARAFLRFASVDAQIQAFRLLADALEGEAVVALTSLSSAPAWLDRFGAKAIALGLDLRGGVHFLLDVDTAFAVDRFMGSAREVLATAFAEEKIAAEIELREGPVLAVVLADPARLRDAVDLIAATEPRLTLLEEDGAIEGRLEGLALEQVVELAVGQNVETLRRRVDELGVAEPTIARQGSDRIVVQLPGLQDTARAKAIIGRRAALELRGVDEAASSSQARIDRALRGFRSARTELFPFADGAGHVFVDRRIIVTGDNIVDASYGSDEAGRPAVHLALDAVGANRMKAYTRRNVGQQMAIVLLDRDSSEVISAPRIESELHARFLIHGGGMGVDEANELALLLRSGSLAAPIDIVEERTIGPSLGADNIRKGLGAVTGGFILVALFIAAYYGVFGMVSVAALVANLLCLTALLAVLGANLTLPGLAGFALTLGMAIDANVLINERIREELAAGQPPGLAIETGYARAAATIIDANVTTLIAGLALFALGSGPVRGFAVVLCLGIATSMFSAVVVSRAFADLVYGVRKGRVREVSIG